MVVVLGNHDLHLLALDQGIHPKRKGDTLEAVLRAKDRKKLLRWLRNQKFFHQQGNLVLVHAGIHPRWSLKKAGRRARKLEAALGTRDEALVLARRPEESLMSPRAHKLRETCRTFTQLRSCKKSGKHCSFTGPPEQAPPGCQPWYRLWKPEEKGVTVVTGHWAAQGLKVRAGMIALDSGCVWGGAMTAVRLEDLKIIQQPATD
jgi:bis(5'-nucleosyl)-tetraphosphatase (symmetrical)